MVKEGSRNNLCMLYTMLKQANKVWNLHHFEVEIEQYVKKYFDYSKKKGIHYHRMQTHIYSK
ncbi:hypothetical protein C2G38_2060906 [Gigaspora rosea]|uniref:Uncharacterized protein n=1 Tax=Gigaspora rosea TaxID=44941 RepID=A0A397VZC9_9GLOM|nr:hypothetical protein C2G38_2060906 [Gigaspora rosea]